MRQFIELTFTDNTPVMVAVDEIQTISPELRNEALQKGINSNIVLVDTVINVKETYSQVKSKLYQFNN